MADGSVALRDLAQWMSNQKTTKFKGKLLDESERKLNSIRFLWDKYEHEWHAMLCALKRFKEKQKKWQIDATPRKEVERDWLSIPQ